MRQKVIIYPGTFDPLTYGHIDIIERGARLGDQLIVAVSLNLGKHPLFSIEERTELVKAEVARINGANKTGLPVLVKSFSGLLTDFATQQGATSILRGLRAVADFEYEFQLATMNRSLAPDIESIFFTPKDTLIYVSSSLVKEIATFGGDVSRFVSPNVKAALLKKITS